MTLKRLLEIASKGYPDDVVKQVNEGKSVPKDGLAQFVECELRETFEESSDEDQLARAIKVMETARDDLNGVIDALNMERQNCPNICSHCGKSRHPNYPCT
jgi:hypothetical protein